jgi:hypothetical protein
VTPSTAAFSKATPADVVATVTSNSSAVTLIALKNGATTVNVSNYTYVGGVLTIAAAYLGGLTNGAKVFTLELSADSNNVTVTVTIAS